MLGLLIGMIAGLSVSPIVAVLIPLLFALLTGGGGFYAATANFSKAETRLRVAALGKALLLFGFLALLGFLYGVMIRTDAPLTRLVPLLSFKDHSGLGEGDNLSALGAEGALELAILKFRLDLLGVAPKQRDEILAVAKAEWQQNSKAQELQHVVKDISAAASKARRLFPEASQAPLQGSARANYDALSDGLRTIDERYAYMAERVDRAQGWRPPAFISTFMGDYRALTHLIYHQGRQADPNKEWQLSHNGLRQALIELVVRLGQSATMAEIPWDSNSSLATSADELLKSLAVGAAPPNVQNYDPPRGNFSTSSPPPDSIEP